MEKVWEWFGKADKTAYNKNMYEEAIIKRKGEKPVKIRLDSGIIQYEDKETAKLPTWEHAFFVCAVHSYPESVSVESIKMEYADLKGKNIDKLKNIFKCDHLKYHKSQLKGLIGFDFLNNNVDNYLWIDDVEVSIYTVFDKESLRRENPNLIFAPPNIGTYKRPTKLFELCKNPFADGQPVLIISGEHGIGKSTFAKMFAASEFKNGVVFYATYNDSLEQTIAMLEMDRPSKERPTFSAKVALLKKAVEENEKCLLIIDGYDSTDNYRDELVEDNRLYDELLSSGVKILITTTVNMEHARASRHIIMNSLDIEDQVDLFISHATNVTKSEKEKTEIKELVNILNGNTYLICLSAALTNHYTVSEIVSFFKARLDNNPLYTRLITDKAKARSLYDHYQALFDLSGIKNDENCLMVLYNLAAMPPQGVRNELFEKLSFSCGEYDIIENYYDVLEKLRNTYFVFLENKRWILHSMIKHILFSEFSFRSKYLNVLISNLNQATIGAESIVDDFADVYRFSLSLLNFIKQFDFRDKFPEAEIAILEAGIISMSDIIHLEKTINQMYRETYDDLLSNDIKITDENRTNYINSLKNLALAIIRNGIGNKENRAELVGNLLERALNELSNCPENEDTTITASKIKSIKAGLYFQNKEYEKAYQVHEENYNIRTQLSNDNSEKNTLCAASLRGMGTAKYYLAFQDSENAKDLYQESFKLHSRAIELYDKSSNEFEAAKTELRKVGSLFKLHECSPNDNEIITTIKEEIPRLEDAQRVIGSLEIGDTTEEKNCELTLKKARDLSLS